MPLGSFVIFFLRSQGRPISFISTYQRDKPRGTHWRAKEKFFSCSALLRFEQTVTNFVQQTIKKAKHVMSACDGWFSSSLHQRYSVPWLFRTGSVVAKLLLCSGQEVKTPPHNQVLIGCSVFSPPCSIAQLSIPWHPCLFSGSILRYI